MFELLLITVFLGFFSFLYFYKGKTRRQKIPGFEPTDPQFGNGPDIQKAGSLHQFLRGAHEDLGPIVSFWNGKDYVISIASPELFRQQEHIFDRPETLYRHIFEEFLGPKCIQFANGDDARQKRKLYDRCYSHKEIKALYPLFNELSDEFIKKWMEMTDGQHIPLTQHTLPLALKSIALASFGDYFRDDEVLQSFCKNYIICWDKVEKAVSSDESSAERNQNHKNALRDMHGVIDEVIEYRRNNPPTDGNHLLIDVMLDTDYDDETIHSDALTYIVGGFHNTGFTLAWALYYMARHPDIQQKLFTELSKILNKNEDVLPEHIPEMPYLQQIFDETLRCSASGTIAARFSDKDINLGGYIIPKGTAVLQALSVLAYNKQYYPEPHKFDPERFSKDQVKSRPPHSFEPFGFAGKRKCPGYRYTYAGAYVYVARMIRQFKIELVDEGKNVEPRFTLVSKPKEEFWIKITERDD